MSVVVKRRGKKESFDEKKVYGSIYSACMECDLGEKKSEAVAERITSDVKAFLKGKSEVNSTEIFGIVIQKLAREHEAVAFMYQTHRDIPRE
ncbi:MAG: ATP cone domain-containing protein [Candidatus Micrarchaeia archaeon]